MKSPAPSHHLRIFLASPADVARERELVGELLKNDLPYDPLVAGHVTFELVSWDDPAAPKPMPANLTPQKAVSCFGPKPSECDIVVVVLWSRLGTHLDVREFRKPDGEPYLSGTEWEFDDACSAQTQPYIFIYRRDEVPKIGVNDPAWEEKRRQYQLIEEFCNHVTRNLDGSFKGSVTSYKTPADFKKRLENDLKYILKQCFWGNDMKAVRTTVQPVWSDPPYPGLRAFTSKEAPIFFGREHELDILIDRLSNPAQRFLAVVGDSGTGKSSLVRAGLLPKFSAAVIEGSQDWRVLTFTPGSAGSNPFLGLAVELNAKLPVTMQKHPIDIADALAEKPERLLEYATPLLMPHPSTVELVLFVDQLEELQQFRT